MSTLEKGLLVLAVVCLLIVAFLAGEAQSQDVECQSVGVEITQPIPHAAVH